MNTTYLINLSDVFRLGAPIREPERIHGGDATSASLIELIQKAKYHQCPFAISLINLQNDIIEINTMFQNTVSLLKTTIVVSHGGFRSKKCLME